MNKLILTLGLPRAGKSTWAKTQGFPIVCPDSIRLALHGKAFIPESEGMVWEIAYLMTKALFLSGHDTVIIDATNNTKKRRDVWFKKFSHCMIVLEKFNTSKAECIKRAIKSERLDIVPIIEKMYTEKDW